MSALQVPAATLADGAAYVVLWARFTGRTDLDDVAPAAPRQGPSGAYMAVHL